MTQYVLQHSLTAQYWSEFGWTRLLDDATRFGSMTEASIYMIMERIYDAGIVAV